MKQLIPSMRVLALFAGIVAMGFAPAQAMMTASNMKSYTTSWVTPVHCKKTFHCHWIKKGVAARTKHCHVCGQFRD
jgi:metal-dependent hydrolase (beta-lactamase superfamily II)